MHNKRGLSLIHSQLQLASHFDNQKFTMQFSHLKSVNLQYITLGCLDDGTNNRQPRV
jgi:hypothetical protein